ncbi:hypothetical protein RUM43_006275 [Polyplax serrata]|uniref:Uncharacterized protein n=1 Tax=Polyplax serrata TaxID=468196 RepID=A0AAN8RV99_POLSC
MLSCRGSQDVIPDEIALRDEILELKRQVMILKRTNQQNLIKFRKYEDEAKRKDRQIEQLMDPRKNSDVTKILSTKGAAILMNLKDQNNSLIQMLLTKDMQIRRLVAEIKTSKLYSASRRTETHRAEVVRLRNLLIKSQEILRENIDLQQKRHRSIYVSDNSLLDLSPTTTGRSSAGEVVELKSTIQSLETHIKYANELLAKKNQEIMNLSAELSALKGSFQFGSCKCTSPSKGCPECNVQSFCRDCKSTHSWQTVLPDELPRPSTSNDAKIVDYFGKTSRFDEKVPHSAPSSCVRFSSSNNSTPKRSPVSFKRDTDAEPDKTSKREGIDSNLDDSKTESSHTSSTTTEVRRRLNVVPSCPKKSVREKWRTAMMKCKQQRRSSSKKPEEQQRGKRKTREKGSSKRFDSTGESSDLEIQQIEKAIRNVENSPGNAVHELKCNGKIIETEPENELKKKNEIFIRSKGNSQRETPENNNPIPVNIKREEEKEKEENDEINGITTELKHGEEQEDEDDSFRGESRKEDACGNCESSQTEKEMPGDVKEVEEPEIGTLHNDETHKIKKGILSLASTFTPEIQRELENLYNNISVYEEVELSKIQKSPRRFYRVCQSFDSSLDSESGYSNRQEPQVVQVEVEINPIVEQTEPSCNVLPEDADAAVKENSDYTKQNCTTSDDGLDECGDDDDDVIVR